MRKELVLTPTLFLSATLPAFAEDPTVPVLDIFTRVLVMGANLWGVLTWVIPVIILGIAIGIALGYLRKDQLGMSATAAGIGVFLAIMIGFSMYKAGPAVKKFAQNAGVMSTEVIDLDSGS